MGLPLSLLHLLLDDMEVRTPAEQCPDVILFHHFPLCQADHAIASETEFARLISDRKDIAELVPLDSAHKFELHPLTFHQMSPYIPSLQRHRVLSSYDAALRVPMRVTCRYLSNRNQNRCIPMDYSVSHVISQNISHYAV